MKYQTTFSNMAALRVSRRLRTKCCLILGLRGSYLPSQQIVQRLYCSASKETSELQEDKNKPIRFSTSKARHLTLDQTLGLGDTNKKRSKTPMYIGFVTMAILTYIIFFLPPSKEKEEDWDLLEDAETSKDQNIKGQ